MDSGWKMISLEICPDKLSLTGRALGPFVIQL